MCVSLALRTLCKDYFKQFFPFDLLNAEAVCVAITNLGEELGIGQ